MTIAKTLMYEGIETIHRLWRGESVQLRNGHGEERDVRVYPLPKQRDYMKPGSLVRAARSGLKKRARVGFNVLTALLFQEVDALAGKSRDLPQGARGPRPRPRRGPRDGDVAHVH
jgi:alkanesulfonate monooxygenase SsuD/methylene tetrahydromethanopterin reductase-like flavin-dependent oxidoreductase (luciferase family)